ncbi:AGC family protein kinase [Tritrichomonas foetus]|uniref:non-specific serine/threonine protein kinase n=1 Tax=Tritrichomonas foetus TaxID=1144522 RepID=A0A1J4KV01_9EUKA|nr:AGC family protein kinase [Tritrichomonas foetus]|eukprot:OHT14954.1 AGC family protein kinase [Tritrichomonas foetus]
MNLKGFVEQKVLGRGTYGSVYKALRQSDGHSYAVKVVNLRNLSHHEITDSVNEIRIMASFSSPFIIRFYEAFCDNKKLCIVSEYSRLGDLAHLIERRKMKSHPLKEEVIWTFLLQLIEGLRTLHSCGVVHRDLKSANILLAAPDLLKIADLGISTVLHKTELARTQIGTPLYIAPEVWKKRPYDQKCDMWSLGVLLYEMMTFTYPFTGRDQKELAQRVCLGKYTMPRRYSPDLISVVRRLLQVNPVLRPSVDELLKMQCIKERMPLLKSYMTDENAPPIKDELLSTIKIPLNLRNVNLPNPTYNKKADIIKPIETRIHVKKGVPIRKGMEEISSPEMKLISDLDWWSPVRSSAQPQLAPIKTEENEERPLTHRPIIPIPNPNPNPPRRPQMPRRSANQQPNPRIRRISIR